MNQDALHQVQRLLAPVRDDQVVAVARKPVAARSFKKVFAKRCVAVG